MLEDKVIEALTKKKNELLEQLNERGGRGVELANRIDRLDMAIDALKGELHCPHCEARLTSGRPT
jgi:hypothetical protein